MRSTPLPPAPRRQDVAGGRRPSQLGAATADYVATLVIVAAVVAAVFALEVPRTVGDWGRYAVCQLFAGGDGDCVRPELASTGGVLGPDRFEELLIHRPEDDTYVPPPCMTFEEGEHAGYQVKIAFVTFGEDYGFIRQEYADGRVRLTAVDSATIGLMKTGSTKIIDLGKLGTDTDAGAEVSFAAGLTVGYGDTWEFASVAEETAMRDQLNDYLVQQTQMRHGDPMGNAGLHLYWWLTDGYVDPPSDPTVTFSTVGLDGAFDASLGLREPFGTDEAGDTTYLDPNVGVALTVDAGYEVLVENDLSTGERTYAYTVTAGAGGEANLVAGGGGFTGSTTGSVKVTRDADNQITALEFVTTREGGVEGHLGIENPVEGSAVDPSVGGSMAESTATVTTTTLRVEDAADRRVVEDWIATNNEQFGAPLRLTYRTAVPVEPAPDDPFQQLLYDHATVSQIPYTNVEDVRSFGLDIKAGVEFGFAVNLSDTTSTAGDATFLSAARPELEGQRVFIPDGSCT